MSFTECLSRLKGTSVEIIFEQILFSPLNLIIKSIQAKWSMVDSWLGPKCRDYVAVRRNHHLSSAANAQIAENKQFLDIKKYAHGRWFLSAQ